MQNDKGTMKDSLYLPDFYRTDEMGRYMSVGIDHMAWETT